MRNGIPEFGHEESETMTHVFGMGSGVECFRISRCPMSDVSFRAGGAIVVWKDWRR